MNVTEEDRRTFPEQAQIRGDPPDHGMVWKTPLQCSSTSINSAKDNSNAKYVLPFDDSLVDRLNLQHSADKWSKAVTEIVRLTKPGGWVELFEGSAKYGNMPKSVQDHDLYDAREYLNILVL
ncbi:hypothetical protein BC938DRAFT_480381 [Jimgerdemannia flammicorona]|uniref:Uncharacterized protein n=1 Tax=Jimgerdemannia flammicorona TaxID=994334 RepID=A0A433QIV9_9FUNG|nr:hypothetical protein BC938DRAFT_480381 [Jimgerdemannia flammicorona]